ncbi:hypothetical protein ACU19_05000 [Actinobaculum suis]|uniref:hypothetical protein n=1 Tax=Actinobaculum suis TaxID=1657 RepID=UPI00066FB7DE|nr:hypothetical protein [Actinobaculum suis]KMY23331.1 hypothetical protein ACU19_05000 [Actinobaculum suis]
MENINIVETQNQIAVTSPYNPEFIREAKNIYGRWNPQKKAWVFKEDYREELYDILKEVYGWVPVTSGKTVNVRVTLTAENADDQTVYFAGQQIAWRRGRDARVSLAENVVRKEGEFAPHGGSMRYPCVIDPKNKWAEPVTLKIKGIPVEALAAAGLEYEIIEKNTDSINREELEAEKARLLARIAEIDELLNN